MKIALIHDLASLKLHALTFRLAGQAINIPGTRMRCLTLADRYDKIAEDGADTPDNVPLTLNFTDDDNLPALYDAEHEIDWHNYVSEGYTLWVIELVTQDMKPIPNTKVSRNTLWNFHKALVQTYPTAPRGLTAWAATARKGDAAVFYQKAEDKYYHAYLK